MSSMSNHLDTSSDSKCSDQSCRGIMLPKCTEIDTFYTTLM